MIFRFGGTVGRSAAALAAALLVVTSRGDTPQGSAQADARPVAQQPQRARLVRLDKPHRQQQAPVNATARTSDALQPVATSNRHAWQTNALALLVLGGVAFGFAARRRLGLEPR